ncbi:hypothetical protein PR048_020224 [Dryococelus australis]|uniref:PiggyBac transposable element-derived protein domain-containing protein n=1 Tax=Dryococelus australis TaxID=614101 RepID=A0ABQ9H5P3_9NEOP|nr:hypothetical protein PR048_020224 [Dryococelus australis]
MEQLMKSDDSYTSDISSDSEPDGLVDDCRPEESSSDDECFLESGSSPSDTCFVVKDVLTDIVKPTDAEIVVQCAIYSSDPYQNNVDDDDDDTTQVHVRPSFTLRFEFLTNSLSFDDRESRREHRKNDRLAAIQEIFDHVATTSHKLYVPTKYCTVDEQLLGFHGYCVFKMFIPSKTEKYKIKILLMCDAKTFYMLNAQVYTGKDLTPKGIPIAQCNSAEMSELIHGTNRNCAFDNWLTSVPLAKKLLCEHSVTMLGTMKSNKPEIPPLFKDIRGHKRNSAMLALSGEETLLSYCPPKKKKKIVTMLSTMHDRKHEDKTIRIPEIIEFYNTT